MSSEPLKCVSEIFEEIVLDGRTFLEMIAWEDGRWTAGSLVDIIEIDGATHDSEPTGRTATIRVQDVKTWSRAGCQMMGVYFELQSASDDPIS